MEKKTYREFTIMFIIFYISLLYFTCIYCRDRHHYYYHFIYGETKTSGG